MSCHAADSVQTLILGSSHTYYGLNPAWMENSKALNLANVSQNFEYDSRILEKASRCMPRLNTVVLAISYFSFFDDTFDVGSEWYRETYYKVFMGIDKYSDWSKYNLGMSKFSIFSMRICDIVFGRGIDGCSPNGFGSKYALENRSPDWQSSGAVAAHRHTNHSMDNIVYHETYLTRILDMCRRMDLRVIAVLTPCWHTYYDCLDTEQSELYYRLVDKYRSSYGFEYYDFMKDKRFVADDFYDGDHLSDVGAMKFSSMIDSIINHKSCLGLVR